MGRMAYSTWPVLPTVLKQDARNSWLDGWVDFYSNISGERSLKFYLTKSFGDRLSWEDLNLFKKRNKTSLKLAWPGQLFRGCKLTHFGLWLLDRQNGTQRDLFQGECQSKGGSHTGDVASVIEAAFWWLCQGRGRESAYFSPCPNHRSLSPWTWHQWPEIFKRDLEL